MGRKLIEEETNDEKVDKILLKGIDKQIEDWVNQKESYLRGIKECNMQINQLNFQRKRIIKEGWRKAI